MRTKLSDEQLASLDTIIEKLHVEPDYWGAVNRAIAALLVALIGGPEPELRGFTPESRAALDTLLRDKVTAKDLLEIRKALVAQQ